MKRLLLVLLLCVPPAVAQQSKNPVTDALRSMLPQRSKAIVAAAEEMPADKYSFKPTPQHQSFGHLALHIVEANQSLCSAIGGTTLQRENDLKESDPKDKLVAAMRRSFDQCTSALQTVDDSKLGEEVTLFGRKATRAAAVLSAAGNWADHYGAEAMYLRLVGLMPPTAQQQPRQEDKREKE